MRYAWDMYNAYNNGFKLKQMYIAKEMHKLRQWDFVSSNRVDYFIANSNYIAKRIKKHYRRNATVIYPGVNNEFYKVPIIKETEEFYLVVSRLVSYKKIDLIIKTFNELKKPLIIVGDGPERKKLQKMANKNIEFKGHLNNREVISLYQKCKAFVYTAEEDFGIVIAEAQAMGKPVVAYGKGGATEIVKQDTGILFNEQNEKCLKEAVIEMEKSYKNFIPEKIRENAVKFSEEKFKKNKYTFSIIIPTINRKIEVQQLLESICKINYEKISEIIIIDQNKENFLEEIVNKYKKIVPIVHKRVNFKGADIFCRLLYQKEKMLYIPETFFYHPNKKREENMDKYYSYGLGTGKFAKKHLKEYKKVIPFIYWILKNVKSILLIMIGKIKKDNYIVERNISLIKGRRNGFKY